MTHDLDPETPIRLHKFSGSFRFFLLFQKFSRFVYPAVVLRFSQKHTCLEQSESLFGLFV